MAITIVATAGGASSNSYVTLEEANTFFEAVLWFDSSWDGLPDVQKNARIIHAARAIDRLNFDGCRYDDNQAMEFPRDFTDQVTDDGEIPQKVKDAQCELIMWQYQHTDSSSGEATDRQIDKISLGKGEVALEYSGYRIASNNLAGGAPESIKALLRHWLLSSGNIKIERA